MLDAILTQISRTKMGSRFLDNLSKNLMNRQEYKRMVAEASIAKESNQ